MVSFAAPSNSFAASTTAWVWAVRRSERLPSANSMLFLYASSAEVAGFGNDLTIVAALPIF
ncbi:hypothetical protein D3C87_1738640 [compost metagenome]